jgi:hypothetical protein
MSLTQWLKTGKVQTRSPSLPGLPDPADSQNPREAVTVQVITFFFSILVCFSYTYDVIFEFLRIFEI